MTIKKRSSGQAITNELANIMAHLFLNHLCCINQMGEILGLLEGRAIPYELCRGTL